MKKLLRAAVLGGLMCLLALMLSGCDLFKPIDGLYALPALPEDYSQLQESIQAVVDELGAEYATINYGNYTSTIQLLDMDNNGIQETAAVSLRVSSAQEKPLRVCLFRRSSPDGTYSLTHTFQGDGVSIHSIAYEDLNGDGIREVVISWQMSTRVYAISAYELSASGSNELMNTSYNERYLTVDLDNDGCREIVVFQQRTSEDESNRAEYYRYQDGAMVMSSVAPLSATISDVVGAEAGKLADGASGIYVTSEAEGGQLTDILVVKEGVLTNVTLDTQVGISSLTLRNNTEVSAADINRDGVLDIPLPVLATKPNQNETNDYYITYWRQFDSSGNGFLLSTASYHSATDGWYLMLPGEWLGKVTVARDDTRSIYGERAVVFYYWPDTATTTPAPFLTIYRLTGENRQIRAKMPGRSVLLSDSSAIYCANLNTDVWDSGMDVNGLISRFSLITPEWSSD